MLMLLILALLVSCCWVFKKAKEAMLDVEFEKGILFGFKEAFNLEESWPANDRSLLGCEGLLEEVEDFCCFQESEL